MQQYNISGRKVEESRAAFSKGGSEYPLALPLSQVRPFFESLEESQWREKENHWINESNPRLHFGKALNRKWKIEGVRKQLSASRFGSAAGHLGVRSREDLALEYVTGIKEKKSWQQLQRMRRGTHYEDMLRQIYVQRSGETVDEFGLAIPKWDPRLSCVADGHVGERGIIEIKVSRSLFRNVEKFPRELGFDVSDRVTRNYYDQIQGMLAILGRDWCDLIVYDDETHRLYAEKIPFDPRYWGELYILLKTFIDVIVPEIASVQDLLTGDDRTEIEGAKVQGS